MDSIHPAAGRPRRKRHWYQFRLRTMLLAVIPLALGSAWLADVLRRDDTVRLTITEHEVVLQNGRPLPLGPAMSLDPLKDDLRRQIGRRASGRPGATLTARIAVDAEVLCGKVKPVLRTCQQLGIEHFVIDSAGQQMKMYIPPMAMLPGSLPEDLKFPPLQVWLAATKDGSVASICIGARAIRDLATLNQVINDFVGDETELENIQDAIVVELTCADGLKFRHFVEAYLAVSRRVAEDGAVLPLLQDVRFMPLLDSECEDGRFLHTVLEFGAEPLQLERLLRLPDEVP